MLTYVLRRLLKFYPHIMPRLRSDILMPAILLFTVIYALHPCDWLCVKLLVGKGDDAPKQLLVNKIYHNGNQEIFDAEKKLMRRIVAVGDLHGDYINTLKVLHMSGVVDSEGR